MDQGREWTLTLTIRMIMLMEQYNVQWPWMRNEGWILRSSTNQHTRGGTLSRSTSVVEMKQLNEYSLPLISDSSAHILHCCFFFIILSFWYNNCVWFFDMADEESQHPILDPRRERGEYRVQEI